LEFKEINKLILLKLNINNIYIIKEIYFENFDKNIMDLLNFEILNKYNNIIKEIRILQKYFVSYDFLKHVNNKYLEFDINNMNNFENINFLYPNKNILKRFLNYKFFLIKLNQRFDKFENYFDINIILNIK
jgi:hypothetical protein